MFPAQYTTGGGGGWGGGACEWGGGGWGGGGGGRCVSVSEIGWVCILKYTQHTIHTAYNTHSIQYTQHAYNPLCITTQPTTTKHTP